VGLQQVARATIKTSPKIFNFFADQTYANKPKAICRELAANAVDSHVMAGKADEPIEIWLPTLLDPTFRVRDHGLGMSHEFMMTQFMCYADGSTKDQSNQAIGGFGIGSKSPFAYVDQYTVKSIFDGIESVYSIFKDEDGIPAIGLLGQRATQESNGVSVEFPVQPDDFRTFEEAAFEALRYFEPLPDVKNASEGSFAPPKYVSRGATWGMREQAGDLLIVMGGVPYPVSVSNLSYKFPSDSPARKLLGYGLDLRLPIGTCSVALSREALSYDDRTIDAIRVACENVIEEVKASFATMFDQYDNAWEAAAALFREVGDNGYGARAEFLKENAQWKGEPLHLTLQYQMLGSHEYEKRVVPCWGYQICSIEGRSDRAGRGGRVRKVTTSWQQPDNGFKGQGGFAPGRIATLLIDDLPQKSSSKAARKIKEFAEETGNRILVVRPDEDQALEIKDVLNGFGNPPADQVVLTSSLPEPEIDRVYVKNKDRPKVRMFSYDGSHIRSSRGYGYSDSINPGQFGKDGVYEIPYADQPTSGLLVVMEQFEIPRGEIQQLVNAGLLNWRELRFVNAGDAKKLNKQNWTMFNVEAERRKKEKLSAYPELAQRLALSNAHEIKWLFEMFARNPQRDFTSRKPLGKIFKLYQQYVEPLDHEQKKLAQFVTAKLPRGVKPEELRDQFKAKQPKANRLLSLLPNHLDDEDFALLQENL
jgi:hypothetical protein